jgi:Mn-containing catalase
MEPGILYISTNYSTAGHLCPCGCGREVVTKLSPARWQITFDGEVSLWPSVAAAGLPCNSHYFITRGVVDLRHNHTAEQAARARVADRHAMDRHRATDDSLANRLWRRLRVRR